MELLERRFGRKQVIVDSHMDALHNLPVVRNNEDTKKIRELYDEIEMNLRSLEAIGVKADTYGYLLVKIIKDRLPVELNLTISRKFDDSVEL